MRLVVGPVPEPEDFHPEEGGWTALKEPSPWMMQLAALPVAAAAFAATWNLWERLVPGGAHFSFRDPGFLVGLLLLIVVHELIHAAFAPGFPAAGDLLVGFWPQKLAFWAMSLRAMPRGRFLLVLLAPFTALSLLPPLLGAVLGAPPRLVVTLSLLNALFACVDLLGAGMILWQVPRGATVRNKGWATWWRAGA